MSSFAVASSLFAAVLLLATTPRTLAAAPVTDSSATLAKMKITIGPHVFSATLADNETAAAFRARLPLTLTMHDVNENEKAFDLPARLPTADIDPRAIRAGDLMLWRSRTVVVFYKNFPTSYRYTRLGRIDDPAGLAQALGSGDVTVSFAVADR